MLKWLRNRLKWWVAADEMAEVERWRVRCGEYDRWLASYPDIALVLQNLRAVSGGAGCTSNIAVDVPWIGPGAGPWDINGLRVHVARIRAHGAAPCPHADWCNEHGLCANGCDARRRNAGVGVQHGGTKHPPHPHGEVTR